MPAEISGDTAVLTGQSYVAAAVITAAATQAARFASQPGPYLLHCLPVQHRGTFMSQGNPYPGDLSYVTGPRVFCMHDRPTIFILNAGSY